MSLSLFQHIPTKEYIIYRYPEGSYVKGKWVKGTPKQIKIEANIQPAKWAEILTQPEADRTSKWCAVFTTYWLRSKKEGVGGHDADRFYWQGELYEVRKIQPWDSGILDHVEALAVRVELTPEEVLP